jgi:hypothetical protein
MSENQAEPHDSGRTLIREGVRSRVYRCAAPDAPSGTVVLKEITEGLLGFTDWASLQFLSGVPGARDVVPRFVRGDVPGRWFVMEDLGSGGTLDDLLQGTDEGAARGVLRELAWHYARLHAATSGREAELLRIRDSLPGAGEHGRQREAAVWLAGREKVLAWFDALGLTAPEGFGETLERIAGAYAAPGPTLAFTHGDPAPSNNHVARGGVWILDFEYGAFRHPLYDLTAWQILCPMPEAVVAEMQARYREGLPTGSPLALDDRAFAEAWATLCAYRAIAMLTWISPRVLEENRPWAGDWSAREALLCAVIRLGRVTRGQPSLAPV